MRSPVGDQRGTIDRFEPALSGGLLSTLPGSIAGGNRTDEGRVHFRVMPFDRGHSAPPDLRCPVPIARRSRVVVAAGLQAVVVEPSGNVTGPAIVAVHGISRNAGEHRDAFAPVAERLGRRLVVPMFSDRHSGYQRLRVRRDELRADERLWSLLDSLGEGEAVDLVGFSGGAQFAHRAAMVTPERVRRLASVAAGWYTFPEPDVKFPAGAGRRSKRSPLIDLEGFGSIPVLIAVGDSDVVRDASLNVDPEIDRRQGANRVERAERWADALAKANPSRTIEHCVLQGTCHSFREAVDRGGLDLIVEQFFGT